MAPFEYLIAFVSVVLALAIAHALSGLLKIIEHRDSARIDWLPLLWTFSLLMWSVSFWWFTYGRAELPATEIHVLHLLYVLGYAATIYVSLGLLYPHRIAAGHDMRAHFERNRSWFFSALLVLGAFDIGDTLWAVVTYGGSPFRLYWFTAGVWLLGSAAALRVENRRYHVAFAVVFAAAVTVLTVFDPSLEGVRTLG
ncbi:MAG: hypothetical protein ACF8NJ_07780 [Phycisphaerales bacterium JB038]